MPIPLPSVSQIVELVKTGATIQAQEQIMRLREAALECQEENLQLKQHLHLANIKVQELEAKLSVKAKLHFRDPVYYMEGDEVPFCTVCYERDGKYAHLINDPASNGGIYARCNVCKSYFTIKPGGEVSPIEFFGSDPISNLI